jgi:hypothetical protein
MIALPAADDPVKLMQSTRGRLNQCLTHSVVTIIVYQVYDTTRQLLGGLQAFHNKRIDTGGLRSRFYHNSAPCDFAAYLAIFFDNQIRQIFGPPEKLGCEAMEHLSAQSGAH